MLSNTRRGHISKNGASDLRRVLVQASYQVGLRDSGALGKFFRRKAKQLGRKRAVIATARKLLIIAWRMLLTSQRNGSPVRSGQRQAAPQPAATFESDDLVVMQSRSSTAPISTARPIHQQEEPLSLPCRLHAEHAWHSRAAIYVHRQPISQRALDALRSPGSPP